jgi:hypothetical protein
MVGTASAATFRLPDSVPQVQSALQSPGQSPSSAPSQRSVS